MRAASTDVRRRSGVRTGRATHMTAVPFGPVVSTGPTFKPLPVFVSANHEVCDKSTCAALPVPLHATLPDGDAMTRSS